jgi:hypothetical protein
VLVEIVFYGKCFWLKTSLPEQPREHQTVATNPRLLLPNPDMAKQLDQAQ